MGSWGAAHSSHTMVRRCPLSHALAVTLMTYGKSHLSQWHARSYVTLMNMAKVALMTTAKVTSHNGTPDHTSL